MHDRIIVEKILSLLENEQCSMKGSAAVAEYIYPVNFLIFFVGVLDRNAKIHYFPRELIDGALS